MLYTGRRLVAVEPSVNGGSIDREPRRFSGCECIRWLHARLDCCAQSNWDAPMQNYALAIDTVLRLAQRGHGCSEPSRAAVDEVGGYAQELAMREVLSRLVDFASHRS